MAFSIAVFGMVLWVVWWALLFAMCITLYRAVRLPSLPWIALYYAVGVVAVPVMQYYGHQIVAAGHSAPNMSSSASARQAFFASPLALVTSLATIFDYGGDLLMITLAFAEAAVLVTKVYPDAQSRLLQALTVVHLHTRAVGVAAVVLTALLPVPAMIYFYTL